MKVRLDRKFSLQVKQIGERLKLIVYAIIETGNSFGVFDKIYCSGALLRKTYDFNSLTAIAWKGMPCYIYRSRVGKCFQIDRRTSWCLIKFISHIVYLDDPSPATSTFVEVPAGNYSI